MKAAYVPKNYCKKSNRFNVRAKVLAAMTIEIIVFCLHLQGRRLGRDYRLLEHDAV
jgi:hypothetical protein